VAAGRCDVTSWESQLSVFKTAKNVSPGNRIDIVVANAGISNNNQILPDDIHNEEPTEPNLQITSVNVVGVLLTTKLALWYFRKQNKNSAESRSMFGIARIGDGLRRHLRSTSVHIVEICLERSNAVITTVRATA
jgi:NAD(P)-dependent dehydrogenase (short-subunit alcohol dehydrogenase family)